jgi:hypothetical protein
MNYAIILIVIIFLILLVIWWFWRTEEPHRKKPVGIIYSKTRPKVPEDLTQVAEVSYIKITGKEDLEQFIDSDIECYISELADHEVAYVQDIFFKHHPEILHLNNNSHYETQDTNLIRNTITDKYLALVVSKYATGKVGVIENPSDFRAKAFRSLLDYESVDPNVQYDTIIVLGDLPDNITAPKIVYPFQNKDVTIKPIEEPKERCYNLGHMLSYIKPQVATFTIENHEIIAHALVHDSQCFILHHRLIDEVDHYLSSE